MNRKRGIRVAVTLALFAGAPSASAQIPQSKPVAISAAMRDSVVDRLLRALDSAYVYPEKAKQMRQGISARRTAGAYARIDRGGDLADALTTDLQNVTHDKHLRVGYIGERGPAMLPDGRRVDRDATECASPFGLCSVQVLEGNIGLFEIRSFGWPPQVVDADLAKAMTALADVDALIIDIRRNGGGSPFAVQLVSSYLFGEQPVLLNSLYWRVADRTDDFYTLAMVSGKRYGPRKPVYVLTSSRTFSAAEEFAYNLQTRKRAVIVGETTGGGAHPGGAVTLGNGFVAFVPSGRAINPITKTNWEGVGIRPDISAPADSALAVALADARRKVRKP